MFLLTSAGSISTWIFRARGAKSASLPVTRSSKRMPRAMSRSACWTASFTHASPCMPIMPRFSGCEPGKAPMPSSVIATGIVVRSANAFRRSSAAPSDHAVPGEDDGAGRAVDQVEGVADVARARPVVGPVAGRLGLRGGPVEEARALLGVLRDVDQHRARTAGPRDVEGLAQRRRDLVRLGDQVVVLRDRQRHARDVGLLEGVGADERARHLAGDADQRRGVHHGRGDARHHVGGAGAGGGHRHAHAAAGAREAVGHVHGALLVPRQDVVDGVVRHRVVDGQDRAARIPEHVGDALPREALPDDPGAAERRRLGAAAPRASGLAGHPVTAPSDADETRRAYFAMTPEVNAGAGGAQAARRR